MNNKGLLIVLSGFSGIVQTGKENGTLIDATHGRKTKSVIITDSDNVVLSYLELDAIQKRFEEEAD